MKRAVSLLAVLILLLVPMISVDALSVNAPTETAATNYADPSTLKLSAQDPNGLPIYNAEDNTLTMTNTNTGRSSATTTAPAAIDGFNYVLEFTVNTIGWSNTWDLTFTFAKEADLTQKIAVCDMYVSYTDAAGTVHQLKDTYSNGATMNIKVFVRKEANKTQGIFIYVNGTLKGEFHKQQDLVPTLEILGANGAAPWQPVLRNLSLCATGTMYGDVNGDGTIDATDVTALSRYLAKWDGYTAADIDLGNADMDQDGAVTPLDEVALNRYFAGWLGYEAPYIPTIVVTDRGVDNTGKTDVTAQLQELHRTGKRIYYPNGTYLFNGETLDFSGGMEVQDTKRVTIRNSISKTNIINFDDEGNLIGLMQNHLEYELEYKGDPNFVRVGSLVSPPLSTADYETKLDFLPSWYNDGGLYHRYATYNGSETWFDWSWNHSDPESNQAYFTFTHTGTANSNKFSISGVRLYKPKTASTPYNITNATMYSFQAGVSSSDENYAAGTWDNANLLLNLPFASNAHFYQNMLKYSNDSYAIQFTVAVPNDDKAQLSISTKRGETFVISKAGVTYNGETLTFADSTTKTTNAVTYTIYFRRTTSVARTVQVYANGAYMKKAAGGNASFSSSLRNVAYDDTRHPLLGYYFGDDTEVVDWEAYWLQQYGIDQALLVGGSMSSDKISGDYWVYQLLNSPNGKRMKFGFQVASQNYGSNYNDIRSSWWDTFEQFYFNEQYRDQVYCYEKDGKKYPVFWLWDEASVRFSLNQNTNSVFNLYKEVVAAFKEHGWDGICVLARFPIFSDSQVAQLNAAGVQWMKMAYPNNCMGAGQTYGEQVDNFITLTDSRMLYGLATSVYAHEPHPSVWLTSGNSATHFNTLVQKAVAATTADPNRTQIITCYNVAEWAEGGSGLVPTVGDRFAYLEAVFNNVVIQ